MPAFCIPFGRTNLEFSIPQSHQVDWILPPDSPEARDPVRLVEQALSGSLDTIGLGKFRETRSAAIAVSDKTRPVPHHLLLPPLLRSLHETGIPPEQITIIIATGAHSSMRADEFPLVIPGGLLDRYRVISHDADDLDNLVFLGETSRETPIWINREYLQASLRIVVGNIEPHQFQGFSGGVKSAAIGLAGRETINRNHAWMVNPKSQLGEWDDNPARQDVEEIGRRVGVHFALNAILNGEKKIVQVLAGDPVEVMKEGIPLSRRINQVEVTAPYDFIIASPGGYPKDINMYQSQKALAHACLVARSEADVLLAASCEEGTGSQSYERWVQQMGSIEEVLDKFSRQGFRVGPHKAFQIARDASKVNLLLYSTMQPDFVRSLLLEPVLDFQSAIQDTLHHLPPGARIGIMPKVSSTIPYLARPQAVDRQ